MDLFFMVFQGVFNIVLLVIVIYLLSKKNHTQNKINIKEHIDIVFEEFRERVKKLETKLELLNLEVEKMEERIKETIKNFEREIEKKGLITPTKNLDELSRQKKREIAKVMIKQGRNCEEIAKELNLPLSEVKLIKEIITKEELARGD